MRMVESNLQLPKSVAKNVCHIGSDRKMNQEFSQTSPMAESAGCARCRKIGSVDLPQIDADSGNPQNRLDIQQKDLNVQCYLEKLESMLNNHELILVDLLKAMRKIARKGPKGVPRPDEQGNRPSGWVDVADWTKSVVVGMGVMSTTSRISDGGGNDPPQTEQARLRSTEQHVGLQATRLPSEALTASSAHRKIWRFLEDRSSGPCAMFTAVCFSLIALCKTVILFSDMLFSLEGGVLWPLIVCHSILAAEFLVRLHVAPSRTVFMCSMPNLFEMICLGLFSACFVNRVFAETRWHEAQQPLYSTWAFLPALMMIRTIRRFKIFQLLSGAFKVTLEVLPVLVYSLGIIIASFAALIMAVEPRENVSTYGEALWLVTVTVFTVGYGDYAPSTDHGRMACSALMMITCLYMAIPIGIVGTAFTKVWEDKDRLMALQDLRDQISWSGLGVKDSLHMFEMCTNGSMDGISLDAFKGILLGLHCAWGDDVIQHVFSILDVDGCGSLDIDEFLFGLFPRQRLFWKQTVEQIKRDVFQNFSRHCTSDLEENEDGFRINRSENDPLCVRPNMSENDLKDDHVRGSRRNSAGELYNRDPVLAVV